MWPAGWNRWCPSLVFAAAMGWGDAACAQDAPGGTAPRATAAAPDPTNQEILAQLREMKRELDELRRNDAAKSQQIAELQQRLEQQAGARQAGHAESGPRGPSQDAAPPKQDPKAALDRAVRELESQAPAASQESPLDRALRGLTPGDAPPAPPAAAGAGLQLQIIDIFVDVLAAAGFSTERDRSLQNLQGGHHDPRKRGFTLQGAEINFQGAVDPYLYGDVTVSYAIDPIDAETIVELEEAYFQTTALPRGYQVRGGHFFTSFGRINTSHAHAWHWMDLPVINSRMFGEDGLRNPGIELSWLVPCEPTTHLYLTVQNANGETAASFFANEEYFEEAAIGGRPFVDQGVRDLGDLLYVPRYEISWECGKETTWLFGLSGAFGPNATGPDGDTAIYGADLTMKWRPVTNARGWPFLVWQSEIMARKYRADDFFDAGDPLDPLDDVDLAGETLRDWGLYTQLLYGCKPRWAYGIRYEFARGNGPSLAAGFTPGDRNDDPFRDNRHRISPLIVWYPSEFARFRIQYNYDHAEHLGGNDAHSLWFGSEIILGAHPAHKF